MRRILKSRTHRRNVAIATALVSAFALTSCSNGTSKEVGPPPTLSKFRDDFNGPLDENIWDVADYPATNHNGTRVPANVTVQDGKLVLLGKGTDVAGVHYRGGDQPAFSYGTVRIRMRADVGPGYVPAAFMWPDAEDWPEGGELDYAELTDADRQSARTTIHWGVDNQQDGVKSNADFSKWVTVEGDWLPGELVVRYNGRQVYRTTDPAKIPTRPMHLVLQLDNWIQGWGDAPTSSTPQPYRYEIDWVEVDPIPGVSVIKGNDTPEMTIGPLR